MGSSASDPLSLRKKRFWMGLKARDRVAKLEVGSEPAAPPGAGVGFRDVECSHHFTWRLRT